ncbi:MAG: glycosyl transferase [Lachnospiraceae bacterium]|nr:glycosyl transferase [Lachnospiraceae bacterium]
MIGTKFIKGQGLGNQLFVYVSARALAAEKGCEFGTAAQELFAMNIHNDKGMYFMDVDLGTNITPEAEQEMKRYDEKEVRLYLPNSKHDMEHGAYVAGPDDGLKNVEDNTLIYGNLQDESYFAKYRDDLKRWLKVKPEYDSKEYCRDNLCIINMRGGEYTGSPELYIGKKYFVNAMEAMKRIRPDMEFMIITDDEAAAKRMFPKIEAHHFDIAKDYVTIKNAQYLILSNSSFAILPAFTSDVLKYAIAPKYWARYNVSDGYWASEQNIYSIFRYMDKKGRLFTPTECRNELTAYKARSAKYALANTKPSGIRTLAMKMTFTSKNTAYWIKRIIKSLERRLLRAH